MMVSPEDIEGPFNEEPPFPEIDEDDGDRNCDAVVWKAFHSYSAVVGLIRAKLCESHPFACRKQA